MTSSTDPNWDQIQEATGYTDEQMKTLKASWAPRVQTPDEIRQGILDERRLREAAADKPGGITDQIRSQHSGETKE